MKHTITQAAWQAITADPPPDPVAVLAAVHGYPRDLEEVLLHFHTKPILWTRGTRFEQVAHAGWLAETTCVTDPATVDAYLATRPDWQRRGDIWYNHVAKARVLDNELIVLINSKALRETQP